MATGWHSIEELNQTRADHVLKDLEEPAALLRAWGLSMKA